MHQGFNIASDQLPQKLARLSKKKKPAIIIDIDETLLKGTPCFSSMIDTNNKLTVERSLLWWNDYKSQEVLPGALDFVNFAAYQGVEIFYISGRYIDVMPSTIKALERHGFPYADKDHILLQPPKDRTLSKEGKRNLIKNKGFEVIMLLGDQLDDLTEPPSKLYRQRQSWVDKHFSRFGLHWIIFPNPFYGGWESSISEGYSHLPPAEKHQLRMEVLGLSRDKAPDPLFRQHMIQAAIWQNFSGSYRALNYQAFNQAGRQLETLVKNTEGNPAIVVDIDGTVLNVTDELALLNIQNNKSNRDKKLLNTDNALINGAKTFLAKARQLDVEIFYLTNRPVTSSKSNKKNDIYQATLANLKKYKLPCADREHLIFTEQNCPNQQKSCNKEQKRADIEQGRINGKKYQIAMLIGDHLDDFDLTEKGLDPEVPETADKVRSLFGRRYIVLPSVLSMPEIRAYHHKAANNRNLDSLTPEELARIRTKLLHDWPGKPGAGS